MYLLWMCACRVCARFFKCTFFLFQLLARRFVSFGCSSSSSFSSSYAHKQVWAITFLFWSLCFSYCFLFYIPCCVFFFFSRMHRVRWCFCNRTWDEMWMDSIVLFFSLLIHSFVRCSVFHLLRQLYVFQMIPKVPVNFALGIFVLARAMYSFYCCNGIFFRSFSLFPTVYSSSHIRLPLDLLSHSIHRCTVCSAIPRSPHFLRFCFKVFSPISFLIFAHNIFCFVFMMISRFFFLHRIWFFHWTGRSSRFHGVLLSFLYGQTARACSITHMCIY